MGEKTTLTVSDETLTRFKRLKSELDDVQDCPDHTNESFLQALMDTWEAANDGYYNNDAEAIADELVARIDMTADPGTVMGADDVAELNAQVRKLQELVERVPEDTAEKVGERFA